MGLRHTAQPHFYIPTKANTPTLHVEPSYHGGSITATVDKCLIALWL